MNKEVFVDKHAFIDVVHVNKNNIKNIYRELHPQSLGDGKYLYWRPTGMGEDEDIQFRMGDYLFVGGMIRLMIGIGFAIRVLGGYPKKKITSKWEKENTSE